MDFTLLLIMFLSPPPADEADRLIAAIAQSGRVLDMADTRARAADLKLQVAPGAPPLLAFRYFSGAEKHRFGNLDVMLDDAGH